MLRVVSVYVSETAGNLQPEPRNLQRFPGEDLTSRVSGCHNYCAAESYLWVIGIDPSLEDSLALEFCDSVVDGSVGKLCFSCDLKQVSRTMLFHRPQNLDVLVI